MNKTGNLKLLQEINLMDDKKVILWLNIASLPLLLFFGILFSFIASNLVTISVTGVFSFSNLLMFLLAFILLIIIHEGIHGLFFKVFNPTGKVKFGFKNGMAYATSPNSYYSKVAFAWIILAPFTLISSGLAVLIMLGFLNPVVYILLAATHGSCCVGDFYFIWLLIKSPKNCLIEDTELGINFYTLSDSKKIL